ncbi:phage tail protein [Actinobacillus equuli subsp. equuli]|uniref:phage tail protein n=1 Tax=Actinobacillus TaxID=713 RepID=UPI001240D944|nr:MULTISPECIES: phage tail protein [Actinobacillus]WGE66382.1 phage tail protein [Actinobacillus equuli subsp. equuli]
MMGRRKRRSVTVGYRYYWDIHSGLGRGPVDEIVELRIDDKTAYLGKPGELTQSQAIYINKPNLFGGENTGGEGGIQGRLEILMGEPDQKPTQMLINLLKGKHNPAPRENTHALLRKNKRKKQQDEQAFFSAGNVTEGNLAKDDLIPGFRGIVSTVFSGLISCYNAYPKKHSYRVRRALKGWFNGAVWYPEKCKIILRNDTLKISGLTKEQEENARQIHAMNPAHILVECATNKSWGGKKDLSDLDLDSYKKAADTLYEEGFGLCLRYNRQGSIKEFMQQVIDHIGAVQYDNVETGKQAIKLLRNDYNPDDLPTFHYDNGILNVQDDDSSATDTTANQIVVKWRDPVTNREDQAIANNIASVQMHGVIAKTVEYKGVPTFDLAARLAQRDLEMVASSLTRLKIVFDMRASELKHGDVFKVHLPDRGIESVIFRVTGIENGNEGEFIVTCMQDVFGLPAANYSTQQSESLYIQPDYTAKAIQNSRLFELPYHVYPLVFSEAELAFIQPTDCFVWSLASTPSPLAVGYDLLTDVGAGFTPVAECSFTPSVTLSSDITPYQTTVSFTAGEEFVDLANAGALMIDDEIVKIESVDFKNSIMTIGRGCADTIPQAHKQGAIAWCYLFATSDTDTKYTVNEQIKAKLLTRTQIETLSEDAASVLTLTTQQRQVRPYPPANVKVDGAFVDKIADGSAFTLTWAHRDRDIQADQLITHTEDSTALGQGVSYKIDLMDGNNIVRSITTDSTEFVYPDEGKIEDEQFSKLAFYTVKDKQLTSLYRYEFTVQGAMQLLSDWDYQHAFTQGNNYLNRYDDNDMPEGKYIMLSSSASENVIYQSYPIEANKYKRFALSYKVGTYNQRNGLCTVTVQLYKGTELLKEYVSEQLGNWQKNDWHSQQVAEILPAETTEIRFKINVVGSISNNVIAFKDIVLRVGG